MKGREDAVAVQAENIKTLIENIVELSVPLRVDITLGDSWGKTYSYVSQGLP